MNIAALRLAFAAPALALLTAISMLSAGPSMIERVPGTGPSFDPDNNYLKDELIIVDADKNTFRQQAEK